MPSFPWPFEGHPAQGSGRGKYILFTGKGITMGKMPGFGMVSLCCLGLALAGCDTANNNNTVPRNGYHPASTFGSNNKDATISKTSSNPPADATAAALPTSGPNSAPAAGFDNRTQVGSGLGSNDATVKPYDTTRTTGMRTPGEAGLVDAPPASSMQIGTSADAGTRASMTTTSNTLPAGRTEVGLPPPPGYPGTTSTASTSAMTPAAVDASATASPLRGSASAQPLTPPAAPGMPAKTTFDPAQPPAPVTPAATPAKPLAGSSTVYEAPSGLGVTPPAPPPPPAVKTSDTPAPTDGSSQPTPLPVLGPQK